MIEPPKRVFYLIFFFLFLCGFLYAGGNKDQEIAPESTEDAPQITEEEPAVTEDSEDVNSDDNKNNEEEIKEEEDTTVFIVNGKEKSNSKVDFNFNLGIGITSFDDITYQKIIASPELLIKKFGIGFDLFFHITYFDDSIQFRREDWAPEPVTFKNIWELYLPKFSYIRFGYPNEPLYFRFGSVPNTTLGNGFIMNRYTNMLFLPETRIFGLQFNMDGGLFDFPYIGFESVFSDVTKWISTGDILGTRLYGMPFGGLDVPVLKDFQIGSTFVIDLDPFKFANDTVIGYAEAMNINTDDAKTWALGWDIYQPIVNKEKITFATFGDVVALNMDAWGEMIGIGGKIVQHITYQTQVRFIGENFIPSYFDSTYDLTRSTNYMQLNDSQNTPFFVGWLFSLGTTFFDDNFVFNITVDGPFGNVDSNENNPLNYPHILGVLYLNPDVIPVLSFSISYEKELIREFRDIFQSDNLLINTKLNCNISAAVISFFYLFRYDENDWTEPEMQSGLEVSVQFF